jgi:predicted amino acid-binding ACT domain protein
MNKDADFHNGMNVIQRLLIQLADQQKKMEKDFLTLEAVVEVEKNHRPEYKHVRERLEATRGQQGPSDVEKSLREAAQWLNRYIDASKP